MGDTVGVVHERHVVVIASWNLVKVDVHSGVRCWDCRTPAESIKKGGVGVSRGERRMNGTRQTIRGDEKNSINRKSANLDIKIWDVVQEPFLPLNWIRCTVLPLPSSLRLLDIKIRWEKGESSVNTVCLDTMMTTICY